MTERHIAIENKTARLFNEKWKSLTSKDFVQEILPFIPPLNSPVHTLLLTYLFLSLVSL